jgi:hypothetical protein
MFDAPEFRQPRDQKKDAGQNGRVAAGAGN